MNQAPVQMAALLRRNHPVVCLVVSEISRSSKIHCPNFWSGCINRADCYGSLSQKFCNRTLQKHATRKVDSLSFGYFVSIRTAFVYQGISPSFSKKPPVDPSSPSKASRTGSIAPPRWFVLHVSIQIGGRESWVGGVHFDVGVAHLCQLYCEHVQCCLGRAVASLVVQKLPRWIAIERERSEIIDIFTMRPLVDFLTSGSIACVTRSVPIKLVAKMRSTAATSVWLGSPSAESAMPALLTKISSLPNSASIVLAACVIGVGRA